VVGCPDRRYASLLLGRGEAWGRRLGDDLGGRGPGTRVLETRSVGELAALVGSLGGHDLPTVLDAFDRIDHDRPTCFICYPVKGSGLPFAGHKDNHAGLMTPAQVETLRTAMNVRPGHEWDRFEGLTLSADKLQEFLDRVPF